MVTAADLFAGMGGTTEGLTQAGIKVLAAANHWPEAVACHKQNHPETFHLTQDLQQADFSEWPDFDILAASPSCVGHTRARGRERAHHDATRSTAWAVVAAAEVKKPKAIMVENVVDFQRWTLFSQWMECLKALGYELTTNVIDAADLGVPQHRVRLFIVGIHKDYGEALLLPEPKGFRRVPAKEVIGDPEATWTPVRKPGRAPATIARFEQGKRQYGDEFLMPYYGSGSGKTGRSVMRPIGTLTCKDRWAYVNQDRMRMLTVNEKKLLQGLPADYRLPTSKSLATFLIGNSVPPALAKWVGSHIKTALVGGLNQLAA